MDLENALMNLSSHEVIEPDFAALHAMNAFHQEIGGRTAFSTHAARSRSAWRGNNVADVLLPPSKRPPRVGSVSKLTPSTGQSILIRQCAGRGGECPS